MKKLSLYCSAFLIIAATACDNPKTEKDSTSDEVEQNLEAESYPIMDNNYMGMQPGDKIKAHKKILAKGQVKEGGNTLEVYKIEHEGQEVGYIIPNPTNNKLIGQIRITSPKAVSPDGLRVGSTYGQLIEIYPGIEIRSADIGENIYAFQDNLAYRLEYLENADGSDNYEIPVDVKIVQIEIWR